MNVSLQSTCQNTSVAAPAPPLLWGEGRGEGLSRTRSKPHAPYPPQPLIRPLATFSPQEKGMGPMVRFENVEFAKSNEEAVP